MDAPAAAALAAVCVWERAFEPVGDAAVEKAMEVLKMCRGLICGPAAFGTMNAGSGRLLEYAREHGILWKEDAWERCM